MPHPFNRFFGGLPGLGGVEGGGPEKPVAARSPRLSWACVLGCRVHFQNLRAGILKKTQNQRTNKKLKRAQAR